MDQIVSMVASKVGIPADQAQKAVEAVLGYLRENPDQIKSLVGVDMGSAGGMMGRVGKMFGR
jgi:hypothetical protein